MRHIELLTTKIYFGFIEIYVKYMSNIFWRIYLTFIKKMCIKYILNIHSLAKIYFIHFAIYVTYIFFPREFSNGQASDTLVIDLKSIKTSTNSVIHSSFTTYSYVLIHLD